jgi:DNA repair protein RadC
MDEMKGLTRELGLKKSSVDSLSLSLVRIGEVYRPAIQRNASSNIKDHNHPNGDPAPEPGRYRVNQSDNPGRKTADMALPDHIIIRQGTFYL